MEKIVKKYTKIYKKALKTYNFNDIDLKVKSYEQRLKIMYASNDFKYIMFILQ